MLTSMRESPARGSLGVIAALVLGLGVASCGGSGARSATDAAADRGSTGAAHNLSAPGSDRDNDGDHNDDDTRVLDYGQPANAADWRRSVALVKRYFAAAAAANGAGACRLLIPLSAESVAEEYGETPQLRGGTCAVVMSKLFRLHHRMLTEKSAVLEVIAVRINGYRGLAVLDFPEIHEARQIGLRRVQGAWKVADLLDGIIE